MMPTRQELALGQVTDYPRHYDAGLLYAVPRAQQRAALGLEQGTALPFHGVDVWNAYEMSWLTPLGKPRVVLGRIEVPALSPNLIESKSIKLYLNSLNAERMGSDAEVAALIGRDLSACAGAPVRVVLSELSASEGRTLNALPGHNIDGALVRCSVFEPDAGLLRCDEVWADETLSSDLLKSNCPVTGQPDWASVMVRYRGPRLDRAALLRYIVSFRDHAEFHEHCVERMFVDILTRCRPQALTVYARYTRRGGLDINPWRSNHEIGAPPEARLARQ